MSRMTHCRQRGLKAPGRKDESGFRCQKTYVPTPDMGEGFELEDHR